MIDQYDFYAWLRKRGIPESSIDFFKSLIDEYIEETFRPERRTQQ